MSWACVPRRVAASKVERRLEDRSAGSGPVSTVGGFCGRRRGSPVPGAGGVVVGTLLGPEGSSSCSGAGVLVPGPPGWLLPPCCWWWGWLGGVGSLFENCIVDASIFVAAPR